jgi:hypothetical protein
LATLAQAMSTTRPTPASRVSSAGRICATTCSRMSTTSADSLALVSGYCSARRSAIVRISLAACSSDTPGLLRAITPR